VDSTQRFELLGSAVEFRLLGFDGCLLLFELRFESVESVLGICYDVMYNNLICLLKNTYHICAGRPIWNSGSWCGRHRKQLNVSVTDAS